MRNCRITIPVLVSFLGFFSIQSFAGFTPRIINGSTATTGTYPFMAAVFVESQDGESSGGCGASLISSEWVLTAAHCFLNEEQTAIDSTAFNRTTVILASDTLEPVSSNGEVISASSVIIHPDYNPDFETSPNANDYDIALIRLATPSNQSVTKLHIADEAISDGTEVIIMGWGATAVDSDNQSIDASNTLLEARQQIVSNTTCNTAYGSGITDNMLCAAGPDESPTTDTCQGDSGGPLIVENGGDFIQVGIVSFGGTDTGPVCGDPEAPGVYARVSAFNSFIQEQIPTIEFVSLGDAGSSDCAGTTIDSSLNLTVSCVVLDGEVFSTGLNLVPDSLVWEWTGDLAASNCSASDTGCVTPDSELGLNMTGIQYNGEANTLVLEFDSSSDGALRWNYVEHFVE